MDGFPWMIVGDLELNKNFVGQIRYFKKLPYLSLMDLFMKGRGLILPSLAQIFLTPFDEYMDKLKEFTPSIHNSSKRGLECEILYVRFADKFLVGVSGGYKDAVHVKNLIHDFMIKELLFTSSESILNKESEALKIIPLNYVRGRRRENYVEFLGYSIKVNLPLSLQSKAKEVSGKEAGRLKLIIPKNVIKQWLINQGFALEEGKGKYIGRWIYLTDAEIILRFNSLISGLIYYYQLGNNKRDLHESVYILKYSLLHTLAAKHRMTLNKVIKKYTADNVNKKLGVKLYSSLREILYDEP